ncbi:transposase [Streptomyces sp. NPDC048161]|uniref:transposase n=1 Tax=Streptomyces sp. NPDC048161 TaxID=3160985 RepID=UPI0033EFDB3C
MPLQIGAVDPQPPDAVPRFGRLRGPRVWISWSLVRVVPLTDGRWARIEPLPPDRTPKRGGRWWDHREVRDHREVIDAIAFKFQTGSQWVHLPEKYGNWRSVYNRLRMWAIGGTKAPSSPGWRVVAISTAWSTSSHGGSRGETPLLPRDWRKKAECGSSANMSMIGTRTPSARGSTRRQVGP